MAQMIGARRNSVSLVASTLQQANFIHYSRGHIDITDIEGLRRTACECYASVKAQYDRLLLPRCTADASRRAAAWADRRTLRARFYLFRSTTAQDFAAI